MISVYKICWCSALVEWFNRADVLREQVRILSNHLFIAIILF